MWFFDLKKCRKLMEASMPNSIGVSVVKYVEQPLVGGVAQWAERSLGIFVKHTSFLKYKYLMSNSNSVTTVIFLYLSLYSNIKYCAQCGHLSHQSVQVYKAGCGASHHPTPLTPPINLLSPTTPQSLVLSWFLFLSGFWTLPTLPNQCQ